MIKIGLVQMNTQDKKQENIASAEKMIVELANKGAQLIMLPEYFNFLGPDELKHENAEPVDGSESLAMIQRKARELKVHIHIGSYLEKAGDQVYNTGVVFGPAGEVVAKYRKIHLFDVVVPGGIEYLESKTITPGDEVVTFRIGDINFGMSTCYDLRFPELFRRLADNGVQVILVPAAFTLQTGRDHWELLLRARAVENLCWVAAVGQWGPSPPDHICYGRSMVINPWGIVVAKAPDGINTLMAEIDLGILNKTRTSFPALNHRRKDLFPI